MNVINRQELRSAFRAREIASAYYLYNPRVTLIDVGFKISKGEYTGEAAVRVHMRNKPLDAAFESFSYTNESLVIDKNKIPYEVDLIEAAYPLQWTWYYNQPRDERAFIYDPLCGGISISGEWLFGYGTLGGFVEDIDSGEQMILSNWHVLAGSTYAPKGLRVFQPGYGDGGHYANTVARLERHAMNQGIDAAVAKLTSERQWVNNQLGIDIGPVTGVSNPVLGMQVTKSGRKTDVTHGVIDGVAGEYPIRYGGFTRTIKYVHRIVPQPGTDQVSAKGDSGAWWLEESTQNAVALHFAGYNEPETALAITMPRVLDALQVRMPLPRRQPR